MTSLDKAVIASYDKAGAHFELYVDPEAAYAYKEGRKPDLKNILVSEEVYEDAKKGDRAKPSEVQKVFGTNDIMKILEMTLKDGEVQLTTEQRKRKQEEKYKQIVAILAREAIDPRTKLPHTIQRIEAALEQARIHVDPFKDPREQIPAIVKELIMILPIKFEKVKVAIKVPPEYAHRTYGTLKNYGIQKEQWLADGSLVVVIEIFAGAQGEVYDRLNKLTAGSIETRVLPG